MKTTEIKVHERGNGWPEVGDVYHDGDTAYVIASYRGPIHTNGGTRGNYIWATAYVADLPHYLVVCGGVEVD